MDSFRAVCDEFYVSSRLFLKLELDPSRETILHFFDRIRREFPAMSKLRRRDDGALILDEGDGAEGGRRFLRLDADSLRFGYHSPPELSDVQALAACVLDQAPPHLGLSDLDLDHMEVVFNFDLEYRGNHDELVAETLFGDHPLFAGLGGGPHSIIDCQPFIGVSLTPDCDTQAYIEVRSRTSTYEVRSGEFEQNVLTVYATLRRYWGFSTDRDLVEVHGELLTLAEQFASTRVVPHVVQPLALAIAGRP